MANYTKNLGLELPEKNEFYSIDKINANNEKIDSVARNENLLDNPWFTVNQRGASSYSVSGGYTVDRWFILRATANIISSGISFKWDGTNGTNGVFAHRFENPSRLSGKTVTASVKIDGTIYSKTEVFGEQGETFELEININGDRIRLWFGWESNYDNFGAFNIYSHTTNAHVINCCKLELGSHSTLANDSAPNYASELLKCQRYYQRIDGNNRYTAIIASAQTSALIPMPITMRTTPSIKISDKGKISTYNTIGLTSHTYSTLGMTNNGIMLVFSTSLTGGTGVLYDIKAEFSADL